MGCVVGDQKKQKKTQKTHWVIWKPSKTQQNPAKPKKPYNDNDNDFKEIIITSNEDNNYKEKNPDFEKFEIWIKENCNYCSNPKNLKQLTQDEFLKLKESYDGQQIADTILQIENRKDLRKKYSSLYRTLINWLKTNYDEKK